MRRACVVGLLAWGMPTVVGAQSIEIESTVLSYAMSAPEAVRLESLGMRTVSVASELPLTQWAAARVRAGYSNARLTLPNEATGEVGGLLDATLAIEARRGAIAVALTAFLPTGEVVQDVEEAVVVGMLASELFPVPVQQWGSGGGVGFDVAYSTRWGAATLGLSGGVLRLLGSEPFAATGMRYQPGTQLRGRAAVESPMGDRGLLTLMVGLQRFGTDGLAGEGAYRAGMRVEGVVSYAHAIGAREAALVSAGVYSMGAADTDGLLLGTTPSLAALFPGSWQPISRQVLTGDLEVGLTRARFTLTPRASVRLVRTGQGVSQGWMVSAGGELEYPALRLTRGGWLIIAPSFMLRTGEVRTDGASRSGVLGWAAAMDVRWEGL